MNRTARKGRRQKTGSSKGRSGSAKPISDTTLFVGLALIGAFGVLVLSLLTGARWPSIAVGYFAAVAALINLYTMRAYRGIRLEPWQQPFARVPLRFVGYGTRGGKPIEAAHDQPATRKALIASLILSGIIVAALALIMIPELRGG